MIKFLHAADLHLGLRITRFEESACERIVEARFEAIENLRAVAAKHNVQFILIAGDIFDDLNVSHKIASRAFGLLEGGKGVSCPVYLIPGNHDPLTPGGVWDRDPWLREQQAKHVCLLRKPEPVRIPDLPVVLFPCPLRHRKSIEDPTAWIRESPRDKTDPIHRIGLAHGSLKIMPQLPEDDHLIDADAATRLGLDYLALGHWHTQRRHRGSDGVERTVYSGTHEPMSFPEERADQSIGWTAYSPDGKAERFQLGGLGTAQLVAIDAPGAPPRIENIEIGRLQWSAERRDLTNHNLGELISSYGQRENRELTILRLQLSGVVDPEKHSRIEELRDIVKRYCSGSRLDADAVLIEPDSQQLAELVGSGVLAKVLQRLQEDKHSANPEVCRVAEHALNTFYRIAWEARSA